MSEFVQTRIGQRSTTHVLDIEKITGGRWAIRYRNQYGVAQYLTGPWSDSRSATVERARLIICHGGAERRKKP